MFNDCFNLKIGWMVSMYIPVVPLGFDMAYPAELQNLCARRTCMTGRAPSLSIRGTSSIISAISPKGGSGRSGTACARRGLPRPVVNDHFSYILPSPRPRPSLGAAFMFSWSRAQVAEHREELTGFTKS